MRRQLLPALVMVVAFTVITGVMYPLVVTGFAQVFFSDAADGSVVEVDGQAVGSRWIGQPFTAPEYFHPRPSAADYNGAASSGSNAGPTNQEYLDAVAARVAEYRTENDLAPDVRVPVDAVTSSGSGLDPHISVANARLQAPRVAAARNLPLAAVLAVVDDHTDGRALGFLGEPGVNVLEVNIALAARDT